MAKNDYVDTLWNMVKITGIGWIIGIPIAFILTMLAGFVSGANWILWIVYFLIWGWNILYMPKEFTSIAYIFGATFLLLVISALLGGIPQFGQYLGWASIGTVGAFLVTITIAGFGTAIASWRKWIR